MSMMAIAALVFSTGVVIILMWSSEIAPEVAPMAFIILIAMIVMVIKSWRTRGACVLDAALVSLLLSFIGYVCVCVVV